MENIIQNLPVGVVAAMEEEIKRKDEEIKRKDEEHAPVIKVKDEKLERQKILLLAGYDVADVARNEDPIFLKVKFTSETARNSTRRVSAPTIKQENFLKGDINCPLCKAGIYVSEKGCNTITCRMLNHPGGRFFHFCYHCRKECPKGYPCQHKCPEGNNLDVCLLVQQHRIEAAHANPIDLCDSDDDNIPWDNGGVHIS